MIADCHVGHLGPDCLHHPGPFVAEHEWERHPPVRSVDGVETAVAYAAGDHANHDLVRIRGVDGHLSHFESGSQTGQDRSFE
jgi:hypothetical protein